MSEELIVASAITCRYVVAFILLAAALPKLLARGDFEHAVANYALLPRNLVSPVARWLPWVELGCGLSLLLGIGVTAVAVLVSTLIAAFAFAVSVNLVRGRFIGCGCFSTVAPRTIGWGLVAGDVVLAAMAAAVAVTGVVGLDGTSTEGASLLVADDGAAALMLGGALTLGYLLVSSWGGVSRARPALAARERDAR